MSATAQRRRPPAPLPRRALPPTPSLPFFLAENLLEARRGSWLPTNTAGPDEDVNIYLSLRLAAFAHGADDPRVVAGAAPVLEGPPATWSRARRADWYRANADQRLLGLGLFDRGDLCRRRDVPWGFAAGSARARDLAVAAACYGAAAGMLARGARREGPVVEVLEKLAARCGEYAQVIGVLAVRRLGLGARLAPADLAALLPEQVEADRREVASLLAAPGTDAVDIVLDLVLDYRRTGDAALRTRIERLAPAAGLDASLLTGPRQGRSGGEFAT